MELLAWQSLERIEIPLTSILSSRRYLIGTYVMGVSLLDVAIYWLTSKSKA